MDEYQILITIWFGNVNGPIRQSLTTATHTFKEKKNYDWLDHID